MSPPAEKRNGPPDSKGPGPGVGMDASTAGNEDSIQRRGTGSSRETGDDREGREESYEPIVPRKVGNWRGLGPTGGKGRTNK